MSHLEAKFAHVGLGELEGSVEQYILDALQHEDSAVVVVELGGELDDFEHIFLEVVEFLEEGVEVVVDLDDL